MKTTNSTVAPGVAIPCTTALSWALTLILLLSSFGVSAQNNARSDESGLKVSGAWGGWHTQLTSFQRTRALFQGGHGGLEFNKTFFIGWGLYKLQGEAYYVLPTDGVLPVDIRYHGPMVYYTPYARRVLHPRFGLQAGFGSVNAQSLPEDRVFLLQPSAGGELNVFRWSRLGAELGYRYALNADGAGVGTEFLSGLYGQASLKFGFSWGSKNEARR